MWEKYLNNQNLSVDIVFVSRYRLLRTGLNILKKSNWKCCASTQSLLPKSYTCCCIWLIIHRMTQGQKHEVRKKLFTNVKIFFISNVHIIFGHVFLFGIIIHCYMKIVECMLKLVTEKIGIHFFIEKKITLFQNLFFVQKLNIRRRKKL